MTNKTCPWPGKDEKMITYHNEEWGVPSKDDRYLFELLTLEGAQAGLSWKIVLDRREAYQEAFHQFDIDTCANLTDKELVQIKEETNVIKHQLKIDSVRKNARAVKEIQSQYGSFSAYLWAFVDNKPIDHELESVEEIPTQSDLSVRISKDLKKKGCSFVGPVTIYSFMQAVGMVNDHLLSCPYR